METTVTGPGVASLTLQHGSVFFTRSVWVDGARSGIESATGFTRVAVGPGDHRLRWQVVRSAASSTTEPSVLFKEAVWEPYLELPLSAGSGEGVTLSSPGANPWIGQNRMHHGDGGAAWSGLKVGPATADAPLLGDFEGPGVLVFQSRANGNGRATWRLDDREEGEIPAGAWTRFRVPTGPGPHQIRWRADLYPTMTWRGSFELAVDEVTLLPLIPLADALDTPGRIWTAGPGYGDTPPPYGIPENGVRGGAMVVTGWGGTLATDLPGNRLLRIRGRGVAPWLAFGGVPLRDPADSSDDGWQDWLWELPPGDAEAVVRGNHNTEIDFAEIVPPPPSLDAALDQAEGTVTTGGGSPWGVAPYVETGRYGVKVTTRKGEGASWLELPVTGPATVRFAWKSEGPHPGFGVLVDGGKLAVMKSTSRSEDVRLDLPPGAHTVRFLADEPEGPFETSTALVSGLTVTPLTIDGSPMSALGLVQPVSLTGEWAAGDAFGAEALQSPVAEAGGSHEHEIRARFEGPGLLSFRWYAGVNPSSGRTASWRLDNSESGEIWAWRNPSASGGWQEESIWLPPGGALLEWSARGSAAESALAALDDVRFTRSAPVPLGDALEAPELTWTTHAANPWIGVTVPAFGTDVALSPPLVKGASARLATTVQGPGRLSFHWKDYDIHSSRLRGEFRLNGATLSDSQWHFGDDAVEINVPLVQENTLEWFAIARADETHASDFIGVDAVTWQPSEPRPLPLALDAGPGVVWSTFPDRPFTGRDDPGAVGGSAAYVALVSGEESWLEATVQGPGLFDFWLREAAGSDLLPDPWDYWSLTIDGREMAVDGTSWQPFWIPGPGIHRIRLTFHHPEGSDRETIAGAVDQVSWQPVKRVSPAKVAGTKGLKWRSGGKDRPGGFSTGGRDDGPAIVLNPLSNGASWVQTTVKGPCELSWDSTITEGWRPDRYPRNSLVIDGQRVIPMSPHPWQRMRLTLPAGRHVIHWLCEPWMEANRGRGPEAFNSTWRISGIAVRRGLSSLAEAVDAADLFALETGDTGGSPVTVAGEDAWEPGPHTSLYFLEPRRAGKLVATWGRPGEQSGGWFCYNDEGYGEELWSDGYAWETFTAGLKAGGFSQWSYQPETWWDPTVPPPVLASLTIDSHPVQALAAAIESAADVTTNGWTGRKDPASRVGGDSAWSLIQRHGYGSSHFAEMTVTGPARLKFWWKSQGAGSLSVSIDGGVLPVPAAAEDWQEVELAVNPGTHVVRWLHGSEPGTSSARPAEAWLDGVSLRIASTMSLELSASLDPALSLSATGDGPLSWHAVAHAEADGTWTEAVRSISGARVLRTTVTGPAVLTFRGRCFAGQPTTMRTRSSVVVIGGGGFPREVAGHFLAAQVDGTTVMRVNDATSAAWQKGAIHIPAGTHEISFRLMTHYRGLFGDTYADAVKEDLQGWLDDLRMQPASDHFAAWAADYNLAASASGPAADADGDGASNELEYWLGTSPVDTTSAPSQLEMKPGEWLMIPYVHFGGTGLLECSSDLQNWEPVEATLLHEPRESSWFFPFPPPPHSATHFSLTIAPDGPRQYYRLRFPPLDP